MPTEAADQPVTEPGCYDLPEAAYHADPCPEPSASRSILHTLLTRSPRHAWLEHPRLNPQWEPTHSKAFDIGSAAHALLLKGWAAISEIDAADYKTKAAKEARDEAYAAGKIPLLPHQMEGVEAMVKAARGQLLHHADAADALSGKPEQTLVWREGETWCRAMLDDLPAVRLDGVRPSVLYDYKTTGDASPDVWPRRAFDHGLHLQEAFYARGYRAVFGVTAAVRMRFVVQETTAPYALIVYEFDEEARQIAAEQVKEGLRRFAWCQARGYWGGYAGRIHTIEPPPWIANRWEDEKLRRHVAEEQVGTDLMELAMQMQAPHDWKEAS